MQRRDGKLIISATDLVAFLECGHLTNLDRALAAGLLPKPDVGDDPALELLQWRGGEHEKRYIALLGAKGREIQDLTSNKSLSYADQAAATEEAMRRGDDVIYQGMVFDGRWVGYPDFLLKKSGASALGDWHYEVSDTKLARTAKASALIQICSYVDQVTRIQGVMPEEVHVVTGGALPEQHTFRTAEMMAYFRHAKARFEAELANELDRTATYPDPVEHCGVCKWFYVQCRKAWRDDDALPIVAGISRNQRKELATLGINTRGALATATVEKRFERVHDQARLQVATGTNHVPAHELLPPERDTNGSLAADRGLTALPPPSEADLFFDIEGDPFAFWEGLEYLFGIWDGASYQGFWAMNRAAEKEQFERVIDLFHGHWQQYKDMHIYHYGSYEPSRMKQLAGRHSTRQDELDDLLRGRVFVDLLRVVRQGVLVGSERYSIKNLEPLYGFERTIELRDAGSSIVEFEKLLEIGDPNGELQAKIQEYNKDDTVSTELLRNWLEARRPEVPLRPGEELPRPRDQDESTEVKEPTEWELQLTEVIGRLTAGIDDDPSTQSPAEKLTWQLANLLDWHRREWKASWWKFFELIGLSDGELFDEGEPIAHLRFERIVDVKKSGKKVYRYSFPSQEHKVGNRSELYDPRLPLFKEAKADNGGIDKDNLTIDLVRPADWNGPHPTALVPYDRIPIEGLQQALVRLGSWVADNGIDADGPGYRAARDLIAGEKPRTGSHVDQAELYRDPESGSSAAQRLARELDATTLAIQGPPGSGKTYTGARMVLELISDTTRARRVGIVASGHKVVTNLLNEIWEAAAEQGVTLEVLQRIDPDDADPRPWMTAKDNGKFDRLRASEEHDFRVLAGTVWLWAREAMLDTVDTLFVDEAGQVALANVLAGAGAARNIVLLGDPQQLDQVLHGSHPPGAERSALGHYLGEAETLPRTRGVFLEKTWRMHPAITDYTSELFYEGKLKTVPGLEGQRVEGTDWLSGSGLRWVEVDHEANTNASPEEAQQVVEIIGSLIGRDWVDKDGTRQPMTAADIRVVSPYNAHRILIDALLRKAGIEGVPVGTVDKFQGQQAPVSIYTMATSRSEDAPRGMDFLYSLHRLNVATSRAKALAIVVASPHLLRAVPKTPEQLRMANGLCAFVEFAAGSSPGHAAEPQPDPQPPTQLALPLDT